MPDHLRRDVATVAVLAQYGRTMLAVQMFELALAQLWLAATHSPRKATGDLAEQLRKATGRTVRAFQRMPPGLATRELSGKIDRELLVDIEGRVAWRNVLAHRYLRERLRRDDARLFRPGTLKELERLASDFERLSARVNAESERFRAEISKNVPDPPEGVREVLEGLAREVLQGAAREPGS
jgi:hypothetical protein